MNYIFQATILENGVEVIQDIDTDDKSAEEVKDKLIMDYGMTVVSVVPKLTLLKGGKEKPKKTEKQVYFPAFNNFNNESA